jgi:hypothetical protein
MRFHASVEQSQVYDHAKGLIQAHLDFKDYKIRCCASVLVNVIFYAASRLTSLSDACARVRGAPSDETLRKALLSSLPEVAELERQVNGALTGDLPKCLRKQRQLLAIDLHEVPYHGQPQNDPREICRGQPRSGTTHFHTYATAYVAHKGQRFTVALTWVQSDESLAEVLKRLLRQVRACGVKIRLVLLDRGFYSIEVIRFLQAGRRPFLMPLKAAGRIPHSISATNPRRFFAWKHSGWGTHTLHNARGERATVKVCVSCRPGRGRFGKRGRQTFVYAYWGFRPPSPGWVRDTYRLRFGIETSYRQANQGLIFTSTRDPLRRLLFVALALILRNVWVWFHCCVLGQRHGTGITLHLPLLRFRTLLFYLERLAEYALAERPPTTC